MDDRRSESRFVRRVWIAWGAWALSLLLPAVVFRGLAGGNVISIPGWQAAAICALNPGEAVGKMTKHHGLMESLVRAMSATNAVMAASLIVLITRRRAVQTAFLVLAFAAVLIDVLALVWYHACLSVGYAVWLASFAMLA